MDIFRWLKRQVSLGWVICPASHFIYHLQDHVEQLLFADSTFISNYISRKIGSF